MRPGPSPIRFGVANRLCSVKKREHRGDSPERIPAHASGDEMRLGARCHKRTFLEDSIVGGYSCPSESESSEKLAQTTGSAGKELSGERRAARNGSSRRTPPVTRMAVKCAHFRFDCILTMFGRGKDGPVEKKGRKLKSFQSLPM